MKTLITLLACITLAASLPGTTPRPDGDGNSSGGNRETRMLQHLLEMDPEELSELRQTIERIEQMSPEEKEFLKQRIGQLHRMPPERVEALRERFAAIPEETRESMREKWLSLSPEERREWRQKLRGMTHEERAQVFREEGFLPAHSRPPENGPRPPRPPEE